MVSIISMPFDVIPASFDLSRDCTRAMFTLTLEMCWDRKMFRTMAVIPMSVRIQLSLIMKNR